MELALPSPSGVDHHTVNLIDLIATDAPFLDAIGTVGRLLEARFHDSAALLFTLEEQSQRLRPTDESLTWIQNTLLPTGPAGGIIGRAAAERRPLGGATSSVTQILDPYTITSRSQCFAAPVINNDGNVLGVVALLAGNHEMAPQALKVVEICAGMLSMASASSHSNHAPPVGIDPKSGLIRDIEFWELASSKVTIACANHSPIGLVLVEMKTHGVSDALISSAATIICANVRPQDKVGYLGSGVFGVLVADLVDTMGLSLIATQISEHLCSSPLPVEAGVGGAYANEHANLAELRLVANQALEQSEQFDVVIIETPASLRTSGPDAVLAHLLQANAIVPHYQPQVCLKTGKLIGVEALARKLGASGAETIPELIELKTSPTTRELTRMMLSKICADLARWEPLLDSDFKASFNATAEELCEMAFIDMVDEVLAVSKVRPGRLCIEVTESESMSNQRSAAAVLQDLRDMGLSVAVDDFGTGYSSLAYLVRLPIDLIKIDRAFVADLLANRGSQAIIGAVVDVASTMGMDVLAEGVETAEQAQCLIEIGVEYGQGWLYSPAMPANELQSLLKSGSDWLSASTHDK